MCCKYLISYCALRRECTYIRRYLPNIWCETNAPNTCEKIVQSKASHIFLFTRKQGKCIVPSKLWVLWRDLKCRWGWLVLLYQCHVKGQCPQQITKRNCQDYYFSTHFWNITKSGKISAANQWVVWHSHVTSKQSGLWAKLSFTILSSLLSFSTSFLTQNCDLCHSQCCS